MGVKVTQESLSQVFVLRFIAVRHSRLYVVAAVVVVFAFVRSMFIRKRIKKDKKDKEKDKGCVRRSQRRALAASPLMFKLFPLSTSTPTIPVCSPPRPNYSKLVM